ncbi:MAG: hypothetical protein RIQ60_3580 [Pseudomonadota bacterium]|jgi:hypothetical protein
MSRAPTPQARRGTVTPAQDLDTEARRLNAEAARHGWTVQRREPGRDTFVMTCPGRLLVLGSLNALRAAMRAQGITS